MAAIAAVSTETRKRPAEVVLEAPNKQANTGHQEAKSEDAVSALTLLSFATSAVEATTKDAPVVVHAPMPPPFPTEAAVPGTWQLVYTGPPPEARWQPSPPPQMPPVPPQEYQQPVLMFHQYSLPTSQSAPQMPADFHRQFHYAPSPAAYQHMPAQAIAAAKDAAALHKTVVTVVPTVPPPPPPPRVSAGHRPKVGQAKCRLEGCNEPACGSRAGFCAAHAYGPRRCEFPGCTKCAQGGARKFCISHGGGRRCQHPGCTKGARDRYHCAAHGGGKRCQEPGCTKGAVGGTNKCTAHGGGRRCRSPGCTKSAQSGTDFCVCHGGGRTCRVDNCVRVARGRSQFCASHRSAQPCPFPDCDKYSMNYNGFCDAHQPTARCRPTNEAQPVLQKFVWHMPYQTGPTGAPVLAPVVPNDAYAQQASPYLGALVPAVTPVPATYDATHATYDTTHVPTNQSPR